MNRYIVRSAASGRTIGRAYSRAATAERNAVEHSKSALCCMEVMWLDDAGNPKVAIGYAYRGTWTASQEV
jgi:hypothetical protein